MRKYLCTHFFYHCTEVIMTKGGRTSIRLKRVAQVLEASSDARALLTCSPRVPISCLEGRSGRNKREDPHGQSEKGASLAILKWLNTSHWIPSSSGYVYVGTCYSEEMCNEKYKK